MAEDAHAHGHAGEDPACAVAHGAGPTADEIAHGATPASPGEDRVLVAVFAGAVSGFLLRYAADAGATHLAETPKRALSGMADACADIQRTIAAIRKSLDADALGIELRRMAYGDAEE